MTGLIVHEWLERTGGAERVLDAFLEAFPDADVRVLWNDAPDRHPGREVRETWLASTPLRRNKAAALPFMLPTWRLTKSPPAEWLLVSSHLFAHHVKPARSSARKFVYAHTPARYIWEPDLDQRGAALSARFASTLIKPLDRRRASEAHAIAANSGFTRERIQRTWNRDATVIYPPVATADISSVTDWDLRLSDLERLTLDSLPSVFLLGASRMVPYKRLDVVIEAGHATGIPVVLAGSGPQRSHLAELAGAPGSDVRFVDSPSDNLLRALYSRAYAYVFPAVEDFGIMPVEAMACGTPVIGNVVGGVAESVSVCSGGVTVDFDDAVDWTSTLDRVRHIDRSRMQRATLQFDTSNFIKQIRAWVLPGSSGRPGTHPSDRSEGAS